MSNLSVDCQTLVQRLQSAEKSIAFIQREHAATLTTLHDEISKWQQKCSGQSIDFVCFSSISFLLSDLTFQMAIGGTTTINSSDDRVEKLRSNVDQLENELTKCRETIRNLNEILDEKQKSIVEYENLLIVNERKHAADLRIENEKQRQLKSDLEQRSTLIAQLTNQLYREKQKQTSPVRSAPQGQMILPDRPKKIINPSEESKERLSNRSSSLNSQTSSIEQNLNQVFVVGRRPPTPPQQLRPISSKDKTNFTKRQLQLLNTNSDDNATRPSMKLSPVLPPIIHRKIVLPPLTTSGKFQHETEI